MRSTAKQLLDLFDRGDKVRMGVVFLLTATGSLVETVGVALVPGMVALLTSPERVLAYFESHGLSRLVAGQTNQSAIFWASLFLAVFFVAKNSFLVFVVYLQTKFVAHQQAKLSTRIFGAYLYSPYTFHLTRNTAELLRNLWTNVSLIFEGIWKRAFVLGAEVLVVVMIASLLLLVDPVSSTAAVLSLGGAAFVYYRVVRKQFGTWGRIHQELSTTLMKSVYEGLGGVKETIVLGREAFFLKSLRDKMSPYLRVVRLRQTMELVPRPLIETVAMVGLTTIIMVMIVRGGDVTAILPSLALYAVAALRLIPSAHRIVDAATNIRYAVPAVAPVHDDLTMLKSLRPSPDGEGVDRTPVQVFESIKLVNVSYRYPGAEDDALRDVSLEIPQGASVGLVGPSGAGKTTAVDVILGLLPPTEGVVLMGGRDIRDFMSEWRRKIGYIPQNIFLTDDSIRRNVAFGVADEEIDDDGIWLALEAAQLGDVVRDLPDQLDTGVGERGVRLSGGQRQRIGIARALYHQPEILVMDEATAALDYQTERDITDVINSFRGSKTMIFIAHRMSTVRRCDVLFFLSDGGLVATGQYDDLMKSCEEFQVMVG